MESAPLEQIWGVETCGDNVFRGCTPDGAFAHSVVFGGQLIAQALSAARKTVEGRPFHSLHAYYVRSASPEKALEYRVEHTRTGNSFSLRRVIGTQDGKVFLDLSASFKSPEAGIFHQREMPLVPPPEDFEPWSNRAAWEVGLSGLPVEMRRISPAADMLADGSPAIQRIWMRAPASIGDDPALHEAALAYLSDYGPLATAMIPHQLAWNGTNPISGSLDHALWRHADIDLRQWHLIEMQSPSANDGRGFASSTIWRRDGLLVATATQEGFIR